MKTQLKTNDICSHKRAFALDNFLRKLFQSPNKIVGPYISQGYTVLDLGCGPGFFTVEMAKMVGNDGRVIGVDVQTEMLDKLAKKLWNTELANRVDLHQCSTKHLNLPEQLQADFVLAYYMVHETPDPALFFKEVRKNVKEGGKMLVVEPPFHVSKGSFETCQKIAEKAGWKVVERPGRKGGYSFLLI